MDPINTNVCPFCGGNFEPCGRGRRKCRFCGSFQPEASSGEEITLLCVAAQKLRLADFDEAELSFDDIIRKYPKSAHAYWGRLMARHGIKYEEESNGSRIPTCYAVSIESVYSSADYAKAMEYADGESREYFRKQAAYMENVRAEWLHRAAGEAPYDIFLCYKESDSENGISRTADSIAAQDLYVYLSGKGYRVFFSRESLREKTGEKYEPYIYGALSTARVMLVYGTKPEYINAVWVKNEWTRYLKRMQAGEKEKGSLLVAYDGFSPYELPRALAAMQGFDANDRRFYSDLAQAVERILSKKSGQPARPTKAVQPEKHSDGLSYIYSKEEDGWSVMDIGKCKDRKIVIPGIAKECVEISPYAFQGSDQLTEVTVLDGLKRICEGAFYACRFLKRVTLPEGLTAIGENAFRECQSLTDILIPKGVTDIGKLAFFYCPKLKSVLIPEGVANMGEQAFQSCTALESISLPQSLAALPAFAFEHCLALKSVHISHGTEAIGKSAFRCCTELKKIVLPESVTEVGALAFKRCRALTEAVVSGAAEIGEAAFDECSSLRKLTLPASLEYVAARAFASCENLNTVEFLGTKAQWKQVQKAPDWKKNSPIKSVVCTNGTIRFFI